MTIMHGKIISFLVVLVCAALAGLPVGANTIHVPADYPTIVAAVNAASPGDTVEVAAGTYSGASNWVNINKALTLQGEDRETTIIDAGGNAVVPVIISAPNVVVRGFTVRNSHIEGIYPQASNVTVEDCIVEDNYTGIYGNPGALIPQSNVQILNNIARDNGTPTAGNGGIYFTGVNPSYYNGLVVSGNVAYHNYASGISVECSTGTLLTGNQVYSNYAATGGSWLGIGQDLGLAFSVNGVVSNNTVTDGFRMGIGLWEVQNCIVQGNSVSNTPTGASVGGMNAIVTSTGNQFVGNTFSGNGTAFQQWASPDSACTGTELHYNNIAGNTQGVINSISSLINAENNWWGAANGPGPIGPGSGDTVSANVDYDPWETAPLGPITVYLELGDVTPALHNRLIKLRFGPPNSAGIIMEVVPTVEFVGGVGQYSTFAPMGYVSAKDEQHTVWRTTWPSDVGGGERAAQFTGFKQLWGGDLNNDNVCDIWDYGILAAQYGGAPPPVGFNADINLDNLVWKQDLIILWNHYLKAGDVPVGDTPWNVPTPKSSITLAQLAAVVGLANARKADMDHNGLINTTDLRLFYMRNIFVRR